MPSPSSSSPTGRRHQPLGTDAAALVTRFGTGKGFGNGKDDGKGYIRVPANKTITLDLNGKTIDRGLDKEAEAVAGGNVIEVRGTLTLQNTGNSETGKITGANKSEGSGAVEVYSGGTFTMEGGSITGNKSDTGAGGVLVASTSNFDNVLTVGGTAQITGNTLTDGTTPSNVLLQNMTGGDGRTITCFDTTPLASGATIA